MGGNAQGNRGFHGRIPRRSQGDIVGLHIPRAVPSYALRSSTGQAEIEARLGKGRWGILKVCITKSRPNTYTNE